MEKDFELGSSSVSSPLLSPDSDSALGTLSDLTPDEQPQRIDISTHNEQQDDDDDDDEFQDDDKIQEEEVGDDSDSESVVSASIQFPLIPSANVQNGEEQQIVPIVTASTASGVPILVKHEKLQVSTSPKKTANIQNVEEQQIVSTVTASTASGIPILVKHEKLQVSTSPKKKTEDVVDDDARGITTENDASSESKPITSLILPTTVTQLINDHGSKVYLIGTAHFSLESQEDVAKTIQMVRPNIVMVELCKSRTAVLQLDEETILNESQSLDFNKMCVIIRQHGKIQGILYLLLLSVSAHITKQLGMAPGGEFRTAFAEARRSVPGCMILLGDRPIQVTLSRALASLSVWQKMKLMWHIMASREPISKEEIEKCKQKDFIEEMLAVMTGQFPTISEVFVKERDIYLTKSLQTAAEPIPDPSSSTGLCPRVVVGVVGIGHVPGIVAHWGKVMDDDIPPIMQIPPPNLSDRVVKYSLKFGFYGLVGFGLYKCLPKSAKSTLFSAIDSGVASLSKYIGY